MPNYLHRTTKVYATSVSTPDLTEPVGNYIENPDVSAVAGQPNRYWIITGDVVTLMDQAARDAVDAAILTTRLDAISDEIDRVQTYSRAFAEVVLDEINLHALKVNAILDAIDNASNLAGLKSDIGTVTDLPPRTLGQLKTAVRGKL